MFGAQHSIVAQPAATQKWGMKLAPKGRLALGERKWSTLYKYNEMSSTHSCGEQDSFVTVSIMHIYGQRAAQNGRLWVTFFVTKYRYLFCDQEGGSGPDPPRSFYLPLQGVRVLRDAWPNAGGCAQVPATL